MTGEHRNPSDPETKSLLAKLAPTRDALRAQDDRQLSPRYDRIQSNLAVWVRESESSPSRPSPTRSLGRSVSMGPSRVQRITSWVFASLAIVGFVVAAPRVYEAVKSSQTSAVIPDGAEYVTQQAQRREFALPDGSQVILAPESKLVFTRQHNGARQVQLTGQAYFAVTHDPNRPFVIQAGSATTRVLGTTFIVRAYPGEVVAQVAVAEGKVSVEAGSEPTYLLAGDVGRIQSGQTAMVVQHATIADVFGWIRGQLAFENAELSDVVKELERTYGMEFVFADSTLERRRVTAVFSEQAPEEMLTILTGTTDTRYTKTGRRVTLFAR